MEHRWLLPFYVPFLICFLFVSYLFPYPLKPLFQHWQRDMILHSQEPDKTCHDKTEHRAPSYRQSKGLYSPIHHSADNRSHGIYLLVENHRFVIKQDITYHTTSRTCNASHDNGNPERLTKQQAFLYSGYSEQRQTQSVKYKPGIFQRFHPMSEPHNRKKRHGSAYHIDRSGHPKRCGR